MGAVGEQVHDRDVDRVGHRAQGSRGRTPAPRSPSSSTRACGRRRRPTRAHRSALLRRAVRPGGRRAPPPPSRTTCGCAPTASRTARRRRGPASTGGIALGIVATERGRSRMRGEPRGIELVDVEEVAGSCAAPPALASASTRPMIATASSISASETSSDGASRNARRRDAVHDDARVEARAGSTAAAS